MRAAGGESQAPTGDPPKVVLYGRAGVPYTEKVRRALIFKGLPYELREPESPEDYRRWSPVTGLLPVVEIGDEHIADSTTILYRLDQLFPSPPLLASDPRTATLQRQLEDWADESFLWHYLRYRRLEDERQARREAAGGSSGSRLLRHVGAWLRAGGTWERPHTDLLRQIGLRLDDLVNFLGTRPFFYANRLSMADFAVYGMLYTLGLGSIPGAEALIAERPALCDYMRRVEQETGG